MIDTIDTIAFSPDTEQLMRQAHIEADSEDAPVFAALVQRARELARPKVLYGDFDVQLADQCTVQIGSANFESRTLHKKMERVGRAFAFVCTCGTELDAGEPESDDFLGRFWWDIIKTSALSAARAELTRRLRTRHLIEKQAAMSPGSGDADTWPIQQQRALFDLLGDVKQRIGVELTDTFLMLPNKTVSGVCFPTSEDFRTCQVCHREVCPSRQAPFDPALWEAMQHD